MKQTIDVIISGGGIAGLTLANVLAGAGLKIALLEPSAPPPVKKIQPSGRTAALMNSSLNILKAAGVWPDLEPQSAALKTMRIIDDSIGKQEPVEVEFPASDIGLSEFSYNIPNMLLRSTLFETAQKNKNIQILKTGFEHAAPDDFGVTVTLQNGKELRGKLLVGADGRSSAVREDAGIKASMHKYNQSALTFLINHSHSHNNVSTEFHRPGGPMALVPLPGNQCSVVWVENTERADALTRLKKHEFEEAFQAKTNNVLGGITLEVGPEMWPLCNVKAESLTAPRTALIAEAAHVMSPITAQGLNLSLRDAAALAESIVDAARLGGDIGSSTVLNTYESRRQIDMKSRVYGVDGMNRVVSTQANVLKELRRAGLKSLDRIPGVKSLAMHVGLAPNIDQTRLAQGEAL